MPRTSGTRAFQFHSIESLESRQLLSGTPGAPPSLLDHGFAPVEWNGKEILARPGRWVAKLDNIAGPAATQLARVNEFLSTARHDTRAIRHLGDDGVILLKTPSGITRTQLHASLRGLPGFRSVEPDFAIWSAATSVNDPSFSSQWALHNAAQTGGTFDADIDAPEAWDVSRGTGVTVAVIDTGIDYTHPDLASSIWTNPGEIPGNNIDDDRNGYIDDLHGWDFFNNDNAPLDDNGHGTHVAGIIAAAGDNALGVAGVAWGAKVIALKFLGADGTGTLSGAIAAINYATTMRKTYGVNVRVTNNSWVTDGYSSALYDALRSAGATGILTVAAAGNGGADYVGDDNDATPLYPASFALDSVISVGATDHADALASFSNYGATTVHVAAPGASILSTTPGGNYAWYGGTSMAAPHVAAIAALAWSHAPSASHQAVRTAILDGADAKSSLSGKVLTGGRVNAFNTLHRMPATPTIPAAPSALLATAVSRSQIDLAWTDNAANETGFKVERSTNGRKWSQIATVATDVTTYSDTRLRRNTTYTYRVRAFNTAGHSAYSNIASTTTTATATATTSSTLFSNTPLVQTASASRGSDATRQSLFPSRRRAVPWE
jgi:subtilisin family serine protease